MRVAFDQQIFLLQEYGGISRYICSLAKALADIQDVEAKIVAPLHYNAHLQDLVGPSVFGCRAPRIARTPRIVSALSKFVAGQVIRAYRPDIVHETYYSDAVVSPKKSASVVTVYDMIVERFPEGFERNDYGTEQKRAAVMRADHVICISESTRRDLLELFDVPEQKVSVVYLGYDALSVANPLSNKIAAVTVSPYLLYVGSRGGYKNFEGMLRAHASSQFLKDNFSIICFGGGVFTQNETQLIDELGLSTEKIKQIGGGDDTLAQLYKDAEAFVYPSLYEGFGIPPLEAMSLGCPVICSNTSSIPEVVGDAGEYFEPGNIESIRVAVENVMQSNIRRGELVKNGHNRCAKFSWSRCANETLANYRKLI